MRKLKFRGRTRTGQWVYGVPSLDGKHIVTTIALAIDGEKHEVAAEIEPQSVGEYTGVNDKNGKEIYEGDILNLHYSVPSTGYVSDEARYVEYSYGSFIARSAGAMPAYDLLTEWWEKAEDNIGLIWMEVIGNIHDNPELLKGGEG